MTINTDTTALLAIDILQGGTDDSIYKGAGERFARKAADVAAACRASGVPVIFLDDAHIPGIDRELELWGTHGIADSPEAQPADFMDPDEQDFIIRKRRYSGFFGTDLDLTLRELGITTLVAIGCDTNICVLHTLADAFYLGYETVLVEDATFTFLCGTQDQAIDRARTCYGSAIVSSDELIASLRG
jgi:nicotinamidase-related amidase